MLEKLPSKSRSTYAPVCPKCKLDMKGVDLIPGFDVLSSHIFHCSKCGHGETVFQDGKRHGEFIHRENLALLRKRLSEAKD
jgi:hypothetical protein